jgi:hypothetical protein
MAACPLDVTLANEAERRARVPAVLLVVGAVVLAEEDLPPPPVAPLQPKTTPTTLSVASARERRMALVLSESEAAVDRGKRAATARSKEAFAQLASDTGLGSSVTLT